MHKNMCFPVEAILRWVANITVIIFISVTAYDITIFKGIYLVSEWYQTNFGASLQASEHQIYR